jgi:predicted aspartyl protease
MKTKVFTINEKSGHIQRICLNVNILNRAGYGLNDLPAIIDTGATYTCISNRVIQSLKLNPVGSRISRTASGEIQALRYIITLKLPQNIIFPNLAVYSFIGYKDLDVLVGMDIITAGDFAVTEDNGNTVVSYRTPHSNTFIDFLKQ